MAFTIAVAGKGGTGKTTIAAVILKIIIADKLGSALAIDADPNSNLGEVLGITAGTSIGELIDSVAKNPQSVPPGMTKKDFLELEIEHSLVENSGFDLLSMGRPEGPGCYCYANNLLRDTIGRIINQYNFCVIDNEAGMEHLSRRTTRAADYFILVSDATVVGMHSAARIKKLADELEFKFDKTFLLINRARDNLVLSEELTQVHFDKIYQLPFDDEVLDLSIKGESVFKLSKESRLLKKMEAFKRDHGFRAN
ncbi:MAG: AAA family ATPase [Candidatus Omnitrophica bacterium]|nr:AAA family ATPase [Candidatus Omnitrophota bacterium]